MEEEKIIIPDFMQKYYAGSDMEGQAILQDLASSYEKQRQNYMMTTHATQVITHKELYGDAAKKIDPEIGFASVKHDFKAKAEKIALVHGYVAEQPKPETKPEKQAFLDKLRAMRESRPKQELATDSGPAAKKDNTAAKELTQRERFLENMRSIRQQQKLKHGISH